MTFWILMSVVLLWLVVLLVIKKTGTNVPNTLTTSVYRSPQRYKELSLENQEAFLRHPRWGNRCSCRRYGFPWFHDTSVLSSDGVLHEPDRCFPFEEMLA